LQVDPQEDDNLGEEWYPDWGGGGKFNNAITDDPGPPEIAGLREAALKLGFAVDLTTFAYCTGGKMVGSEIGWRPWGLEVKQDWGWKGKIHMRYYGEGVYTPPWMD